MGGRLTFHGSLDTITLYEDLKVLFSKPALLPVGL
jgi:hypothetical protein